MMEQTSKGVVIRVKIIPKSTSNEIVGWENEELKVRIAAPPDKGKANQALIKFLAKFFEVTQAQVVLLSGETSRHKKILFEDTNLIFLQKHFPKK